LKSIEPNTNHRTLVEFDSTRLQNKWDQTNLRTGRFSNKYVDLV